MSYRATINTRSAYLSSPFGEEFARRRFGDDVVDQLPVISRGPRKGKIKGQIEWAKVERGGWVKEFGGDGHVENRAGSIIAVRIVEREFRTHDITATHASWEDREGDMNELRHLDH